MSNFINQLVYSEALLVPFLVGIAGLFLFRFRNQRRDFINALSILILLLSLIELHLSFLDETVGRVLLIAVGAAIVVIYLLRFTKRDERRFIDWLKIAVVVVVAFYPAFFYSWHLFFNDWRFYETVWFAIFPVVFFMNLYDRFILKPNQMKSKFVIVLVVQSIAIVMSLMFAFYQHVIAEKATEQAVANVIEAQQQHALAAEFAEKFLSAEQKLKNCK